MDSPVADVLTVVGGAGASFSYLMRGVDSGTGTWTTWVAASPDPDGDSATPSNTTPALVGTIIAGSGVIQARWES